MYFIVFHSRTPRIWHPRRCLVLQRADFDRMIGPLSVQGQLDVGSLLKLSFDELFRSGLELVWHRRWEAASSVFERCLVLRPESADSAYNLSCCCVVSIHLNTLLPF